MKRKLYAILMTATLLVNLFALSFVNVSAAEPEQTKVFNYIDQYTAEELAELTADPEEYYVSVFVEFNYPDMDTTDLDGMQKATRNWLLQNYYRPKNLAIANELGIDPDCVSAYTPFAEISYDTLAEFEENKSAVYAFANSDDIKDIDITLIVPKGLSVKTDSACEHSYFFENALADIGLVSNDYDGSGIKVGMIDDGIPTNSSSVPDERKLGSYVVSHATDVQNFISGDDKLAPGVTMYYASLGEYNFQDCVEHMFSNNVDIINLSCGEEIISCYDNRSAYLDYIVYGFGCFVVKSAGNTGENLTDINTENDLYVDQITSPGMSANCITVGAINRDKEVAFFSSYISNETQILKPDLVAPGEKITGHPADLAQSYSGTSIAAPLVTAIAARLMDEFPALQSRPYYLRAILLASCNRLPNQTLEHDPYAGAGLVNYSNAREILLNSTLGSAEKYPEITIGEEMLYESITIPAYHTLNLHLAVQIHSDNYNLSDTNARDLVTNTYSVIITDTLTEYQHIYAVSTTTGAIPITNNTATDLDCRLQLFIQVDNCPDESEYIAYAYTIDPHDHAYATVWVPSTATEHRAYCECGSYTSAPHTFEYDSYGKYRCTECGYVQGGTVIEPWKYDNKEYLLN